MAEWLHRGTEVWVKYQNHTPTGAFKGRGEITFMDWLVRSNPGVRGICTATRGNHGQSQARAATATALARPVSTDPSAATYNVTRAIAHCLRIAVKLTSLLQFL